MLRNKISDDYFEWIYNMLCGNRYRKPYTFRKLLMYLHSTEFIYFIPMDSNRYEDGINLRYRFAYDTGCACADSYLDGPCSVLEMMVALSISCEEIMDEPRIGDRTSQWFWGMVTNLGLGSMFDCRFDIQYVSETIYRFLHREYEPDGKGGLFTVKNCEDDLREVEIWYQACWYLDTIT